MTALAMTQRCRLDAIAEQDEELLVALHTSSEVRRHLGGATSAEAARTKHHQLMINPARQAMTIVLRQTGEKIGLIEFDLHHDGDQVEVSYMVLPRFWGAGLAREALAKALDIRFLADNTLSSILAETQTANSASCRLLESWVSAT